MRSCSGHLRGPVLCLFPRIAVCWVSLKKFAKMRAVVCGGGFLTKFLAISAKPDDQAIDSDACDAAMNSEGLDHANTLATVRTEEVHMQPGCRLAVYADPRGPAADRFRYLRIRIHDAWQTGKLKSVLITSALPQDGKSTVAVNLASSLCEHGRKKVLLIEADLHRPSLRSLLGLEAGPGLVECLVSGVSPMPFIRRLQPLGWYLLAAGGKCRNPAELLQSGALPDLLSTLRASFDWILIDSPPVVPITDAISLARDVDAILMVVRAGSTPRDFVQRSITLLGRQKLLAVVLNGLEGLNRVYSKYGYYNGDSSLGASDSVDVASPR